ncbi:TetR family transcriptional regulator [Microbacterium aurugineum]
MTPDEGSSKTARARKTRDALLLAAARVFSRQSFADARLKDISDDAGISQGSLYFHFGNKDDIAAVILETQQEHMTAALEDALATPLTGLDRIVQLAKGLAAVISSDVIVQAGIKLGPQLDTDLTNTARAPYFEWVRITEELISAGIEDGSIRPTVDARTTAEFLNELFVGIQVFSELADSWVSMPARMETAIPYIIDILTDRR